MLDCMGDWVAQTRPIPISPESGNNQGPGSSKAILKSKDLADLYKNFEDIGFLMRVDKVLILEIKIHHYQHQHHHKS